MFKYIVICSILILTSCNVGEDYSHTYFFSDKEAQRNLNIQPNEEIINNNWYEIFNDSDLNTLIRQAMTHNISVRQGI